MFRFTIRDVLWLAVVVVLGVGWWFDHRFYVEQLRRATGVLEDTLRLHGIEPPKAESQIHVGSR